MTYSVAKNTSTTSPRQVDGQTVKQTNKQTNRIQSPAKVGPGKPFENSWYFVNSMNPDYSSVRCWGTVLYVTGNWQMRCHVCQLHQALPYMEI